MTDQKKLRYADIESTPANKLMELSYEKLDAFVAEARQIKRDAEAIIDWLTALRSMKATRSRAARGLNGGGNV